MQTSTSTRISMLLLLLLLLLALLLVHQGRGERVTHGERGGARVCRRQSSGIGRTDIGFAEKKNISKDFL